VVRFSLLLVILLGILGGVAWFQYGRPEDSATAQFQVLRRNIKHTIEISGKFTPFSSMVITPRQSGRLVELLVKEGQQVDEGTPLFSMRLEAAGQTELLQKRSEVEKLQFDTEALRQRLKEKTPIKELLGAETIAKEENELTRLQLELKSARERLLVLESELGLEQAKERPKKKEQDPSGPPLDTSRPNPKSRSSKANTLVYVESPIRGIVTIIDKRPGDFLVGGSGPEAAGSSRMVMTVADMSTLQVKTRVMEADLRFIRKDLPVKVRLDAYPDLAFAGRVSQIGGQGRMDERAEFTFFDVYVSLDDRDDRILPGMNATVELIFAAKENVLTLPVSTVAILPQHSFVRVPDPSSPMGYREHEVLTGVVNENEVEIVSGLNEGDWVLAIDFSTLDLNGMGAPSQKGSGTFNALKPPRGGRRR
jgi:multidrug efflux pump subunit AcrA (membrane-fusion protein)